ncbi:MAG: trypsin-like peptidase domain-containing protein [Bacteroidetes bacterium]|nr:trypsin-like peptidase domain-containing protein [Bacteroidota bacterium]
MDGRKVPPHSIVPYSLKDFITKHKEYQTALYKLPHYCKKLENDGLLLHEGIVGNNPYLGHTYYTINGIFNRYLNAYNSYDYLVEGFLSVRNKFQDMVLPVEARTDLGDFTLGSSFVLTSDIIITAKHCVSGVNSFRILDVGGNYVPVLSVHFSQDEALDIAIIKVDKNYFRDKSIEIPMIRYEGIAVDPGKHRVVSDLNNTEDIVMLLGEGNILDEVLTLGYPPISGFETTLIANKAEINSSFLRVSSGSVLAKTVKYRHEVEYYIINAKVKGGNSGGPILDKLGRVIGMIVEMPTDIKNHQMLDSLGYGIAIPSKNIAHLVKEVQNNFANVVSPKLSKNGDWYSI